MSFRGRTPPVGMVALTPPSPLIVSRRGPFTVSSIAASHVVISGRLVNGGAGAFTDGGLVIASAGLPVWARPAPGTSRVVALLGSTGAGAGTAAYAVINADGSVTATNIAVPVNAEFEIAGTYPL